MPLSHLSSPSSTSSPADRALAAALLNPNISATKTHPLASRLFALVYVFLASKSAKEKKRMVKKVGAVMVVRVENEVGEERSWRTDLKRTASVRLLPFDPVSASTTPGGNKGRKGKKADVIVRVKEKDLVGLATGKLNPQKLYESRRLTLTGDPSLALSLLSLLSTEREKLESRQSSSLPRKEVWGEWKGRKREEGWMERAVARAEKGVGGVGGAVRARL
ncbi:hypothetical protein JCM8547_008916 [Rhodosporidiobolus lusitaniae]